MGADAYLAGTEQTLEKGEMLSRISYELQFFFGKEFQEFMYWVQLNSSIWFSKNLINIWNLLNVFNLRIWIMLQKHLSLGCFSDSQNWGVTFSAQCSLT